MLVRALKIGYAGKDGHVLRQPGDVFEIDDAQAKVSLAKASGTWFELIEPVVEPAVEPVVEPQKHKTKNDGDALV